MPSMPRTAGILFTIFFFAIAAGAQDTLPRFSATARGTGKILVSWHNPFTGITQINIQRSTDSLKNFTTLLTVPDPRLPENGAMDTKAPHPNFYYRLFVVLENGKYFFTSSRRPHSITSQPPVTGQSVAATTSDNADPEETTPAKIENTRVLVLSPATSKGQPRINTPSSIRGLPEIEVEKTVYIRKGDNVIGQIPGSKIRAYRDSLLHRTKDTLVFIDGDSLLIKPFVPKEVYHVSSYVFTSKFGNIQVVLPDAARKRYSVKFFDDTNKLLFELADIKDPSLILDKTNFHHAGWFRFELYDGDQLKEKNRFLIPKDF